MATSRSRSRPWLVAAGILLVGLLVAGLLIWVFRAPLGGWAARKWCSSQDLTCELDVRGLGLSGLTVENVKITAPDGSVPVEAQRARVTLDWPGFLKPAVTLVDIKAPVVRASYHPDETDQPLRLGGLEKLMTSDSSGTSMEIPEIDVSEARIELDTPAGPVVMHGTMSGKLPYRGTVQARIEPLELTSGDDMLVLREGDVDLSFVGFKVDGSARLDLKAATFDGLSAENITLDAEMADTLQPKINWQAEIGRFAWQGLQIEDGSLSGSLQAAPGEIARQRLASDDEPPAAPLAGLGAATLTGKAGMLAIPQVTAGASDITLSVTREDKTQLNVELALRGRDIEHETARAGELTLTGKAQLSNDMKAVDANGNIVLEGGVLAAPQRQRVVSAIGSGAPFTGHGTALKAWLDEALSGFSAGTGLHFSHSEDGGWSLVSTGTVSAKTERGATLSLEPKGTKPAINIAAEGVEVSGLASLSGGRAPQLAALINSAQAGRDGKISVEAGGVSLKPWTADGLTLGADLNEVHFTNASSVPRLQTVGEIEISGPFYGNTLAPTRLFGGIDAAFDAAGLRVQTYNTRCLGLDTAGVDLTGGIHIDDTSLQLCPRDGRVVRQNRGVYAGTVEFGSLSLPFRSEETSGALDLDTAVLDWRAGQTARLDVTANAMRVPLAFGGKTLNIAATGPQLAYETTRPATITAKVGATEFGGTLLPADLGLDSADFEARLAESGLNGTANARRVELRDPGTDPLYEPLTGDLSATFSDGVMNVTGPVTTPRAGQTIAEADLTLDLVSLDGTARVATPELAFRPGGFQPTALSDRVRGFLSNARGTMAAEATFTFDGGTPSGQGWVSVSDFGFDTLRLGAVNDVNGRLEFSDILSLSTPPGQAVTLGEINPGIPLKDGTIRFQLTNATQATIEEARWPFAGGELVVNRSSWTIAGTEDIVRIDARGLELTDIVSVFNLPDIQAEGTVSGSFPVEIVGPNAYIRDAVLKADESGGTIAYTGGIGDAASQADQRVDLAFKALRDFRFTVLELGVEGNLSGDMVISMKLVGRSPNVLDGAPFAFNIGIDSKLMQLINTGRSMTTTDWLATAVSTQAEDEETGNAEGGEPVD